MKKQLYSPNNPPSELEPDDDYEYTIEVGIKLLDEDDDEIYYTGYFEPLPKSPVENDGIWWIDYGGFTFGHREIPSDDIDYWFYLK